MRGYINGAHNSGVTSIASDTWPKNTKVLAVNDVIRFEGHNTDYTVTTITPSTGISDSSGILTSFVISPSLSESVPDNTAIICPSPRTIESGIKTAFEAETGTICYFMQFDFEDLKHITSFTDSTVSPGVNTKVTTTVAHGWTSGNVDITQTGGTYDGSAYTISNVGSTYFDIVKVFTATETGVVTKDATTYLATTPYDISWNSQTWQGVGGLLQFEEVSETSDMQAGGVDILLSGVDQVITTLVLGKAYRGRFVKVWLVHINTSGNIITDPLLIFWGRMNGGFEIEETRDEELPGTVNVRGKMEDRIASISKVTGIMTNVISHQQYFSTDKFFSFVPKLVGKRIPWGKVVAGAGSKGGFCFITTAVMISKYDGNKELFDNCYELTILRNFRDNYLIKLPGGEVLIKEYYEIAPKIVEKINQQINSKYIYEIIYNDLIIQVLELIKSKKYIQALSFYRNFIYCLKKAYVNYPNQSKIG